MSIIHCKARSTLTVLVVACLAGLGLSGCDVTGEQIIDWKPGNTLAIDSATDATPATVTAPDTASYYVKAYTINKDYTWTVNGEPPLNVGRGGQFIDVVFPEPGTYTIKVDDGEYTGTLEVTASKPEE